MTPEQKEHIARSLKSGVRLDGRAPDEFREISIEFNASSTANGSARVRFGESEIVAGVKMSLGKPYPDTPEDGVLMVNTELLPLANPSFESGPPSIDSIEIARVIDRGIRESHTMDTKKLCVEPEEKVWMVQVDVIPINFDGNLISIGGFGALAALMTAKFPVIDKDGNADPESRSENGLELSHYPIPITVGRIGEHLFIDPTQEEEEALDARLTITVMENNKLCALQKGGQKPLTMEEIHQMVDLAVKKSQELRKKLEELVK